jgi:hypothetical protein
LTYGSSHSPPKLTGAIEADYSSLGAAQDGPCQLECSRRPGLTGHHEFARHHHPGLLLTQLGLDAVEHPFAYSRHSILEPFTRRWIGSQLSADYEQLTLPAQDRSREVTQAGFGQLGAGDPQRSDGFVDRAIGFRTRLVLGDAAAIEQAGGAVVAFSGRHRALGDGGPALTHRRSGRRRD